LVSGTVAPDASIPVLPLELLLLDDDELELLLLDDDELELLPLLDDELELLLLDDDELELLPLLDDELELLLLDDDKLEPLDPELAVELALAPAVDDEFDPAGLLAPHAVIAIARANHNQRRRTLASSQSDDSTRSASQCEQVK